MGSTVSRKLAGETNVRFLRRIGGHFVGAKWPGASPGEEVETVALQAGRGGVYGVLRVTDSIKKTEYCFARIIKVETRGGDTEYKTMTECDVPDLAHMPEKLFRLLTPADQLSFGADDIRRCKEWRARCQKLLDNKAALKLGVRFTVPKGIVFGSGRVSEFMVENPSIRMFVANPGTPQQFRCQFSHETLDNLEMSVHA
jgi:hypothetical protein